MSILKRAAQKVKERYDNAQETKKVYQDIDKAANKRKEAEKLNAYRTSKLSNAKAEGIREGQQQATRKSIMRGNGTMKEVGGMLQGFSQGSAKALNNGAFNFGGGTNVLSGMENITGMGGSGQDILSGLEIATGVSKKKQLNPDATKTVRGGTNITINMGGQRKARNRETRTPATRKQKDWQDNLEDVIGF